MPRAKRAEGGQLHFWCPGCDKAHAIAYEGPNAWGWNGDLERPTFTPSVLVHPHQTLIHPEVCHHCGRGPDADGDHSCTCPLSDSECLEHTLNPIGRSNPANITMTPLCHSFVTDGRIQFLTDSTHELAGQTVDLPEWPYAGKD